MLHFNQLTFCLYTHTCIYYNTVNYTTGMYDINIVYHI